jgi:hypothetical protein
MSCSWVGKLINPHTLHVDRTLVFLGVIFLICLTASGTNGCEGSGGEPASQKAFDSMVEICQPPNTMEPVVVALGQYVGDGSKIIAILNYEDMDWGKYRLDDLWVGLQKVKVQAFDPRTGATIITVPKTGREVPDIGDVSKLRPGQEVTILTEFEPSGVTQTSSATIAGKTDLSSLFFQVVVSNGSQQAGVGWSLPGQGAVVTDQRGRVLGLVGASYNRLIPGKSSTDLILPVVKINSIMPLLSQDIGWQPWASGPAVSVLATSSGIYGYTSGVLTTPADYDRMTAAVQELLKELGRPLARNDLPGDYPRLVADFPDAADGSLLTLVYPRPVELRSPQSGMVIHADWIGLEWGRSEDKPSVLFFGFTPYLVAGGFTITGDVAPVIRSIENN